MKISILQPCHENWNQMLPEEKGRFCISCQKCVTDFTKLSDKEVLNLIQKPDQCGKFSKNQLDRINLKLEQENQFQFPRIFHYSALMIGLGFGGTLVAQEKEKLEVFENDIKSNIKVNDSIILKKQIIDQDGFPLAEASVVLKNSQLEVFTDENGFFELKIPKNNPKSILKITDPFGYSQEVCIADINQHITFNFPDEELIEYSMVGGIFIERTFTGKILHTISWPFRQIGKLF